MSRKEGSAKKCVDDYNDTSFTPIAPIKLPTQSVLVNLV
jgi:hypothetical protein